MKKINKNGKEPIPTLNIIAMMFSSFVAGFIVCGLLFC